MKLGGKYSKKQGRQIIDDCLRDISEIACIDGVLVVQFFHENLRNLSIFIR